MFNYLTKKQVLRRCWKAEFQPSHQKWKISCLPERIVIGDGQSGENPDDDKTWKGAGYTDTVESRGVALLPFNDTDTRSVEVPGAEVFESFPVYIAVTDCSFFFNLPLTKCHNLGCSTLNVKNLMGYPGAAGAPPLRDPGGR